MQSGKKTLGFAAVALLATLASACLDYPRNGQMLATKATTVSFEGWHLASNVEIKLSIWNNATSAWDLISHPTILTGTSGLTDNAGDTWYFYSAQVTLPQAAPYWGAGVNRRVIAKVKAVDQGGYQLTTYDVSADACIEQYRAEGGQAIVQHCESPQSPVVTLGVSCGASGKICCLESPACDFGKNCSSGACSATCGGQGQTCCEANPGCGGDTICKNNSCVHCGNTGEICCSGSSCDAGNICKNNSCVECGSTGEACCGGNSCDAGNVCKNGSCSSCGGLNQPCCGGNSCSSSGLECISGTCQVPPCGGQYQACCAGDTCPGSSAAQPLICNAVNKCIPCGHEGQSCCFPDGNPPFGCEGNLACMNEPGGYQCQCDYDFFPNGCD